MKKRIGLLLAVCLMLAMVPFTVFAADDPSLVIKGKTITFKDSVFIKYAVDAENADDVRVLIWTSPQSSYEYGTQEAVLSADDTQTVAGKGCQVYTYTGLTARQMTDDVYARAYTVKNGTTYYSNVTKYSILDYAYNMLGKTGTASTDQKLIKLLKNMLEYGASAQEFYDGGTGYRLDRLANDEYYQVRVIGGLLDMGFDRHLYKQGESVTIKADAADESGTPFSHWENGAGNSVGTDAQMQITVGTANEKYTAVYGEAASSTYKVTFADYDGRVIDTQSVAAKGSAVPPADPVRDGYVFTGWSGSYTDIQGDITLTAQYEKITGPAIIAGSAAAAPGEQVEVEISLKNNPGIAVSALDVTFDSSILELNSVTYGDLFREGGEKPPIKNPVRLTWSALSNVSDDTVYATLTFTVKDSAKAGSSAYVNVSYQDGNIIDIDEEMISFRTINGKVTVR